MAEIKQEVSSAGEGQSKALLQLNKMDYRIPPFMGIVVQRTQLVDRFVSASYVAGQEMILDSQTGGALVNGRASRLNFVCTITGTNPNTATFGVSGSMANVIQRISIYNKNGDQLDVLENANLWINQKKLWERRAGDLSIMGNMSGFAAGQSNIRAGTVPVAGAINSVLNFSIQMSDISPIFDTDQFLPWQMMQGLKIRITLAPNLDALVNTDAVIYTITDPTITWDVTTIADQFKRKLNEISAKTGLYMVHKAVHNDQTQFSGNLNFQLTKPVSKAIKCHVVNRLATASVITTDYMSSFRFDWGTVQARLSNIFFPQQAIVSSATQQTQLYMSQLSAWNHLSGSNSMEYTAPAVLYYLTASEFSFGHNADEKTRASWTIDLVKNQVDDLQGYAINSSRTLNLSATSLIAGTAKRTDIYLQYLKLITYYADRAIVKE